MKDMFESEVFQVGCSVVLSIIGMWIIFGLIKNVYKKYHKKEKRLKINAFDILIICAIPEVICFCWDPLISLLNLIGIYIPSSYHSPFPEITTSWVRIAILILLIISFVSATKVYWELLTQKDNEPEVRFKKLYCFLLTCFFWLISGFWSLYYVISWIL